MRFVARSSRQGRLLAVLLILGGLALSWTACGPPRPSSLTPGPPPYPAPLFDGTLPEPSWLGAQSSRLLDRREGLLQEESGNRLVLGFVESFPYHPYVAEVRYLVSVDSERVIRMEYELRATIETDLSANLGLLGALTARYGAPAGSLPSGGRVWRDDRYDLHWSELRLTAIRPDLRPVSALRSEVAEAPAAR